jgi:hypothetical protein
MGGRLTAAAAAAPEGEFMSTIRTMKTSLALSIATCMLVAAAPAHAQTTPVIAVQTVNTEMQTMFPPSNNPFDFLGGTVMPGTSPAITAFQTSTNPAIAALGTGVEIAFQATTGLLSYVPPGGTVTTMTETVQTGTSPSIAVF